MTTEEIIAAAREAGLYVGTNLSGVMLVGHAKHDGLLIHLDIDDITRFAAIIAAGEREECSKARAGKPRQLLPVGTGALLSEQQFCFDMGFREGAAAVRAAIRSRGNK